MINISKNKTTTEDPENITIVENNEYEFIPLISKMPINLVSAILALVWSAINFGSGSEHTAWTVFYFSFGLVSFWLLIHTISEHFTLKPHPKTEDQNVSISITETEINEEGLESSESIHSSDIADAEIENANKEK